MGAEHGSWRNAIEMDLLPMRSEQIIENGPLE